MPHIDDGTLHALLDGALRTEAPEEAAAAEAHLERCDDCRARLDEAAALRDDAAAILAPPSGAGDAKPDFEEVVARSRTNARTASPGAGPPDPAAGRRRRRRLAWTRGAAWAATLVLALGTGYLIRDLAGPEPFPPGTASGDPAPAAAPAPAEDAGAPPTAAPRDRLQAAEGRRTAQKATEDREVAEAEADLSEQAVTAPMAGTSAVEERAAAPETAGAGTGDAATGGEPGRWTAATVAEVATALGGPLYLLPRAELVEVYIGEGRGGPAALSIQRLSSGVPVRVTQRRPPEVVAESVEESGRAVTAAEPGAPGDRALSLRAAGEGVSRAAAPSAMADAPALPPPETAQVVVEGFVLELTASLPADLLAILGTAARPAPR